MEENQGPEQGVREAPEQGVEQSLAQGQSLAPELSLATQGVSEQSLIQVRVTERMRATVQMWFEHGLERGLDPLQVSPL
jgi:hypothetical protein